MTSPLFIIAAIVLLAGLLLLILRARREHSHAEDARAERDRLHGELRAAEIRLDACTQQLGRRDTELGHAQDALEKMRVASDQAREQLREAAASKLEALQRHGAAVDQQLAAMTSHREAGARELAQRSDELSSLRRDLREAGEQLRGAAEREARLSTQLSEEKRLAQEKLAMQHNLHAQLEERFKGIAAQVLERNTEKFEGATKTKLGEMSEALRIHIKELQTKLEHTHDQETRDRVALRGELTRMVETSARLDRDAADLSRALRGDRRAQGAWGELVLERVLEQCGLREGVEYEKQATFCDEESRRLRPDVVVHLPGKRAVVIDAKVSLTAYVELVAAGSEEEGHDARARHVASVRAHIQQLSDKEYWRINALDAQDYVLMFVPVESALAEAVRNAPELYEEAFRKHVILVTPSTLLATLRTIEHTWRVERQNETARAIVDQAGKLYDKFEAFVGDLKKVGERLQQAQSAYGDAFGKLCDGRGNLVKQAEKIRLLGIKVKKALPQELVDDADELASTVPALPEGGDGSYAAQ